MKLLKSPNKLNFFGARRLSVAAPHFEYIELPIVRYNLEQSICDWIEKHTKGRYFAINKSSLDSNNQIKKVIKIGFEDGKELSYFTLACPILKYN